MASTSRNSGHVIRGFIFGVPFGLVAVAFLLFMPRGKKREDALFGAWLGSALGVIVVAVSVAAISVASSSGATTGASQSAAQADRVVGVIRRCTLPYAGIAAGKEGRGDDCTPDGSRSSRYSLPSEMPKNIRLEVTVRTAAATTYTVDVPPETAVAVGDTWPPTR